MEFYCLVLAIRHVWVLLRKCSVTEHFHHSKVCAFVTWIKQHSVVMFIRQRYLLLIFYVKQNCNVDTKVTQQNWFRFFIRFNFSCFKSFDFRKCRGKSWWRRNRTRCWGRRRSTEFGVKRKILPLLTFYIQNNINWRVTLIIKDNETFQHFRRKEQMSGCADFEYCLKYYSFFRNNTNSYFT